MAADKAKFLNLSGNLNKSLTDSRGKLNSSILGYIVAISSFLKILLSPAYHSTDLEVHRNWLAITHSLPISKWYTEDTSIWTLDYPPLFAWFQYLLSIPAVLFDPQMLAVSNLNYKSRAAIFYLRLTVIFSDLLMAYATKQCCDYLMGSGLRKSSKWASRWESPRTVLQFILLFNVGLLIVDNIHFQYNGPLFGLLLLSVAAVLNGRVLQAAFYFSVLLMMKHIFLYMAPVYFVYLLRNYCYEDPTPGFALRPNSFRWKKLFKLGAIVFTVFAVSLGPFLALGQGAQILSRLFPFKRGLFHSYWAPNLWALYSTTDKLLESSLRFLGVSVPRSNITLGLTHDASYSVLPNISPAVTFVLTAGFAAPCLVKLWKYPGNPIHFVRCLILCALTSFIFGWHVHEKAILMAIVPLAFLAVVWQYEARVFFILSVTGYYSLFPLLPLGLETPIKYTMLFMHFWYARWYVANLHGDDRVGWGRLPLLSLFESTYVFGLLPLSLVTTYFEYHVPSLPFMPLLMTSAYCSVGILYSWGLYYVYFMRKQEEKRKLH